MQKFIGMGARLSVAGILVAAITGGAANPASAQTEAGATMPASPTPVAVATIKRIESSPAFAKAMAAIDSGHDKWVADIITLTEIPAPPYKETARAQAYRDMFIARGLTDVEIDAVGNVTGLRKGGGEGLIIVSAHLDTVFPEGTPVKVRREGDKLFAPGVGDDSTGLATQLAFINAMNAADIRTKADILFVGTVGEEGRGDLRGVRHLFTKGKYQGRAKAFFSIDGGGMDSLTIGGAGSKRYRVTFKGPGGHSFGAFGLVNPMVAMAGTVSGMYTISIPQDVKTTYAASTIAGGTSVNSIPNLILAEFDMRSASPANLKTVETRFLQIIEECVAAENAARDTRYGKISAVPELIGDRPAGTTPASDPLVQAAAKVLTASGYDATLTASSTDSNIPISMGIPAITLSAGGGGFRAHALDEYISVERVAFVKGLTTAFDIVVAAAGIKRP